MATKQPTIDQHEILHVHYPNDCCLCRAEGKVKELEYKIQQLEEKLKDSNKTTHNVDSNYFRW